MTLQDILFVYSTPLNPQAWDYMYSVRDAARHFDGFSQAVCFVGHTHFSAVYTHDARHTLACSGQGILDLAPGSRYIINCGSVGPAA